MSLLIEESRVTSLDNFYYHNQFICNFKLDQIQLFPFIATSMLNTFHRLVRKIQLLISILNLAAPSFHDTRFRFADVCLRVLYPHTSPQEDILLPVQLENHRLR